MADTEKQTPVRQSLCGSLRRDGHWKCLCLSLLIIGCLAAISWCHLTIAEKTMLSYLEVSLNSERSGPCKEGYIYIPVAFVIMLYLVYLVECWHSHTRLELRYKCDITTVYDTISEMQSAMPVIWWKATCYHYVRRTRQVMRYRNGDAFTSTQVYYERVDSNTAGAAFNFTQCGVKDISRPLCELEKYPAIKIKVSKGFSFANLDTEFEFEEQRAHFFQEYETKDDYMEGREGMDLMNVNFKEYMIAFRDPNNLPWYVSHIVFWIASLLLLSWPLRAIIEYKTAHLHYHIHKLFGSNYLDAENYPNLMSRVSTMNSVDLEMSIRNNNVIVPSYSEAMLADSQDLLHRRDYGAIKGAPSKFPRSLTNVTLAARSSVARRSITPAVTMNRVKRFKSCSAFGKSDSTESSLNSGTIRHQIQQLLRDRGKLQRKRTGTSSCSISGLSIGNGNVRFNVGTPGTPDDMAIAPSFSSHSVTSSRTNETLSLSEGIAINNEITSRSEMARAQRQGFQNSKAKRFTKNHAPPLGSINRSKSVPESDTRGGPEEDFNNFRSVSGNGSCTEAASGVLTLDLVPRIACSIPLSVTQDSTAVTIASTSTPTSPPSPPAYDDAIRMRRIAPSRITSVPSTPVNSASEIGLTGASHGHRTRGEISVTGEKAFRDWKQNTDSIPNAQSIEPVINRCPSGDHSSCNCATADFSSQRSSQSSVATNALGCSTHHDQPQQQLQRGYRQQLERRGQGIPTLKALPKVSTGICSESEDSDSECLHDGASELEDLENVPGEGECLSTRTQQHRSFRQASISDSATSLTFINGTDDLPFDPSANIQPGHERNTPSTAIETAAAAIAQTSRGPQPDSPSRRMETTV